MTSRENQQLFHIKSPLFATLWKGFSAETKPDFPGWDEVPNLTVKLRQILKRSLRVLFRFWWKFVSSGDLLLVKYYIHQLSHCEFIQLRKCQRGVFQNHGACRQAFPFLAPPLPLPLPTASISVAFAPSFAPPKSEKRLERAEALRKRLLRRLLL